MRSAWRSFAGLWRQESWLTRLALIVITAASLLGAFNLALYVILGLFGDWRLDGFVDTASNLLFLAAMYLWIYWRRRALNAEATRPNQLDTYSNAGLVQSTVHFATTGMTTADAARAVERQRARREAMQHRSAR